MSTLSSTRPYIIRAVYQWISDNDLTPYLRLDVSVEYTEVPQPYVKEGQITLNISSVATRDLVLADQGISFLSTFEGQVYGVYAPVQSVMALYAKENGKGVFFDEQGDIEPPPSNPEPLGGNVKSKQGKSKPSLKVIK